MKSLFPHRFYRLFVALNLDFLLLGLYVVVQESRKRKKRRLEELQRSVLFLTHENHQLREQNELLRQMLVGRLPGADGRGGAVAGISPKHTTQHGFCLNGEYLPNRWFFFCCRLGHGPWH